MERNDRYNDNHDENKIDEVNLNDNEQMSRYEHTSEEDPGLTKPVKNRTQPVKKESKPKRSGAGMLFSGLIGGIIAAVVVVLLFTNNIIPLNNNTTSDSSAAQDNSTPEIAQTIATGNTDVASNIEEVSEAVVGIINRQQQNVWAPSQKVGSGSGIIYKKEDGKAYVVTNHHVVEGASEVDVVLNNGDQIKAKVLGSDPLTDLAVLQIDGKKIKTVAKLGSSEDAKVGETVIAIGNPLGMNFANSVTKGIISGKNRSVSIDTNKDKQADWVTEVIQTDAAINPGNSGGALVNSKGEVIGINSMKIAKEEVEGIGFAIPIDTAIPIMKQLENEGDVARPFIGVSTASLQQVPAQYRQQIKLPKDVKGGMVVAQVQPGSPADKAGLQQFDIITKINGEQIKSILDLRKYLYTETKIGDTVEMEVYREGEAQTVKLTLVERAEQQQ
ncbi:serine protease [Virgibacillus phasianinus]|uniref:Serine protease n=1 Tax=Virgibacillus phasianinus TaxID=2017483 RepID=A0A220TZS5_9BACI|nr:trypsin-like peptidase domain-containing protein [Virgibacillus phasianinus]ASK61290.1 serine protease [Virgibacillus phasianinus]